MVYHRLLKLEGAKYLSEIAQRRAQIEEINRRLPSQQSRLPTHGPITSGMHQDTKVRQDVQPTKIQPVYKAKAQSTVTSTNTQTSTGNRISEDDLTLLTAFGNKFKKMMVDEADKHFGFVKSIQSTTSALVEQIGQDAAFTLDQKFDILDSAHALFRKRVDDKISELINVFPEQVLSNVPNDDELYETEAELKRAFHPLEVVYRILTDAVSEASAEKLADEVLPSWQAVTEFFEWKAGYSFDDCLSDCVIICSEIALFGDSESVFFPFVPQARWLIYLAGTVHSKIDRGLLVQTQMRE